MNVSIGDRYRNALTLVASRYQVTRQQIIEIAPLLFYIAAEQSLAKRRERLHALEQAAEEFPDYVAPIDWHAHSAEAASINARDLFAKKVLSGNGADEIFDWSPERDMKENPLASHLRDLLSGVVASRKGATEDGTPDEPADEEWFVDAHFYHWGATDAPNYYVCDEDVRASVGGDEKATEAIIWGCAALHEMPRDIQKAGPAEKASWACEEWGRSESDIVHLKRAFGFFREQGVGEDAQK